MIHSKFSPNTWADSLTISDLSEKELIKEMIKFKMFQPIPIQRRLAQYPDALQSDKDVLIVELMELLWKGGIDVEIFNVFKEFDIFLTVSGTRGHFRHQFKVFLLGIYTISIFLTARSDLFGSADINQIFYTWLMAATLHDFGIPMEEASRIAEKLSKLYKNLGLNSMAKKYSLIGIGEKETINEDHLNRIELKRKNEEPIRGVPDVDSLIKDAIKSSLMVNKVEAILIRDKIKDNHGYIGAALLCRAVCQNKDYETIKKQWIFGAMKKAMGAIALHCLPPDIEKYRNKINFQLNPFAYLLFLTDNIQEWGRPSSDNSWPVYNLAKLSYNEHELKLHYNLTCDDWSLRFDKVKKYLDKKEDLLALPKGPEPPLGIKLVVIFERNYSECISSITIDL